MRQRVVVILALALVAAACGPTDWPMFRYDAARTGASPDTSISKDALQGSMQLDWTGTTADIVFSSPAVANGMVYVGSGDHNLYAFDAAGGSSCSGSGIPKSCAPLWTADTGGSVYSSPAVANGVVFVNTSGPMYPDPNTPFLLAYDAGGGTNCSGKPKRCAPLWTATNGGAAVASPAVANGVVYATSVINHVTSIAAFDAAGNTNCSGTPKTCAPLWTAPAPVEQTPAVANGVLYVVADDGNLYAFDAAGNTNCSGTPKTCAPLWTALTSTIRNSGHTAVANGVVYVLSFDPVLYAFDAAGNTNCSGRPKTCAPLWTAATGGYNTSSPAVANGVVYAGSQDHKLYAFDASGLTGCSGVPKTCHPLWTATTGATVDSSPAVAKGVVYVGSVDHNFYAFDASGLTGCSGTPKTCHPLWSATTGGAVDSSPAITNGMIYVGSGDNKLYAFGLEKIPPDTSVVRPSTGATLSGTTTLVASASDDVRVSRVEFRITGGSYRDKSICTAGLVDGRWRCSWDTRSVPEGTYALTSVAYDPAGNVGRSANVSITVDV